MTNTNKPCIDETVDENIETDEFSEIDDFEWSSDEEDELIGMIVDIDSESDL